LLLSLDFIPDQQQKAQTEAIALSLFSDSQTESLMQISSTDYEAVTEGDIEFLGEHVAHMRELVKDNEGLYEFAALLGFGQIDLPSDSDLENLDIYITGEVASQYDNNLVSEEVFKNSESFAVIFVIIIALAIETP